MPRKKSSEKRAEQGKAPALLERPVPTEARARPTGEYRQAFCPVCGLPHGMKRVEYPSRSYWVPPPTVNFWEWIIQRDKERGLDNAEPFGVIQEVGAGKGHSFKVVGYFDPDSDQDGFYPLIKARLLLAVQRWIQNGWLTKEELAEICPPLD